MAEKLFTEFPPVSTEQWDEVIIKDLKGADYDKKLVWKTHEGFPVRPYYRAGNLPDSKTLGEMPGQFPYVRGTKTDNNWLTRQDIDLAMGLEAANAEALDILNKGVESLGFKLSEKKDLSVAEMETLLKGVHVPAVEINFTRCCPRRSQATLDSFLTVVKKQGFKPEDVRASFDFSPLHRLTVKGHFCEDKAYGFLAGAVKAVKEFPKVRVIGVQACDFNNAGSSLVQELAFGAAIGNEYMARLAELGVEPVETARRIKFTFGISSNYFMEIAKFRAARVVWANIVKAWGVDCECALKMKVHAVTSRWNQTVYDAYVNMLRGTTETMSAAIAGVDSIEVVPFDDAFRAPGEFSNRIARNVQSILKEESHFNNIVDPGAGSYYIEELTQSIIDASWKLFKDVEEKGGYTEAFKAGFVQEQVKAVSDKKDKLLAQRRETLLGTNQYPNFLEKAVDEVTREIVTRDSASCCYTQEGCEKEQMAEPLRPYRGAQPFEAMRLATDRGDCQPMAFMLTFGNLAMCRARAQFSCNFFAVAGFKVVDNNRFSTIEEGVEAALKAKADIVVACSADDEYLENVPKIAKLTGDKAIVVVAGDPECRPQLEEQGIDHYIHVKCNVLDTLKEYQKALGVKEL